MKNIKIEKPQENWTKFPNSILDNLDKIPGNSLKILSYMVRQTIGFHREKHKFSISYLRENTGISSNDTVLDAIEKLIGLDLITKYENSTGNEYSINWSNSFNYENCNITEAVTDHGNSVTETVTEYPKTVTKTVNIKRNNIKKEKDLKKSEHLIENEIINYWNTKNSKGQAEPVKNNKRTLDLIRSTINQYSEQELKAAIDELFNDKWSIENKQIRLNRLIKPDKRDQNMHRYKGQYRQIKTFPDWQNMSDTEIEKTFRENIKELPFQTDEILKNITPEAGRYWKEKYNHWRYALADVLLIYKNKVGDDVQNNK